MKPCPTLGCPRTITDSEEVCIICKTQERAVWMIKAMDGEDFLSEWEASFISSLKRQVFGQGKIITENQFLKLEEVYNRH